MKKTNTQNCFLVAFLFFVMTAYAQQIEPVWEQKFGTIHEDVARAIVLNNEGDLVVIGSTNLEGKSGKDILFSVVHKLHYVNQKGQPILLPHHEDEEKKVVQTQNDAGNAIIQTRDGGYVIVGYTESNQVNNYQGKKDGLVIKVADNGDAIWLLAIGSRSDDELFDVIEDKEGNIVVVGQKNGQCIIAKLSAAGELLWKQTIPHQGTSVAYGLLQNKRGEYIITGEIQAKNTRPELLLAAISEKGVKKWQKTYPNAIGRALHENKDGTLLIAGSFFSNAVREDMLLMKTYSNGNVQWQQNYGGRGNDGATDIVKDYEGNFYLSGYNRSFERAAKRNLAWVIKTDKNGLLLGDKEMYFGGNSEDQFNAITVGFDGFIYAAGFSASKKLSRDAWVAQVSQKERVIPTGTVKLSSSTPEFVDASGNHILEPNERGYVSFEITNNSEISLEQIEFEVTLLTTKPKGLEYIKKLRLNYLPAGEKRMITIPFKGKEKLATSSSSFEVKLSSKVQKVRVQPINFTIETLKETEPEFLISQVQFKSGVQTIQVGQRGEPITVSFYVTNQGDRTAKNVRIRLNTERYVNGLSENYIRIKELAYGVPQKIEFTFQSETVYKGDDIVVKCHVSEAGHLFVKETLFTIPLDIPIVYIERKNEINLYWHTPNPDELQNFSETTKNKIYELKVKAISNQVLKNEYFSVWVNGEEYGLDAKFNEVRLSTSNNTDGEQISYSHTYTTQIELKEGMQEISVLVDDGDLEKATPTLRVTYQPDIGNLHVLSIGIFDNGGLTPTTRLKYTGKDAMEFGEAFKKQEGVLYENVYVTVLSDSASTTKARIQEEFEKLLTAYSTEIIQPEDVLIIYISSHGDNRKYDEENYDFYIRPSDWIALYENKKYSSALKYNTEILDPLSNIKCQKLLFIDACKSGAVSKYSNLGVKGGNIDDNLSSARALINSNRREFRTITSCDKEESSYEADKWENGAFTEGILEAFDNVPKSALLGTIQPDLNNDNYLSLSELYIFLHKRVPFIVNKFNGLSQTPYMDEDLQYDDFPIFFYKKQ